MQYMYLKENMTTSPVFVRRHLLESVKSQTILSSVHLQKRLSHYSVPLYLRHQGYLFQYRNYINKNTILQDIQSAKVRQPDAIIICIH